MANTFKVKSVQNVPNTSAFVYQFPDDTTAVVLGMFVSNTNLNTSIPGMNSYKKDSVFDKIEKTKSEYEQFPWLFKG